MYSYTPAPQMEGDESLKKRLLYVAGDGPVLEHRIALASGQALDDLAWRYNLKRRAL